MNQIELYSTQTIELFHIKLLFECDRLSDGRPLTPFIVSPCCPHLEAAKRLGTMFCYSLHTKQMRVDL